MKLSLIITLSVLLACHTLYGQTQRPVEPGGYGLVRSNVTLTYDYGWGAVKDRFNAKISYEFFKNRHFTLSANVKYSSCKLSFDNSELSGGFDPDEIGLNGTHDMMKAGLTATYRSRLFGKPFVCIGMVDSDWGDGGFARVSGIAMGLVMLRANRNTQFGIGPMALINTNSKIPVFIVFMYRHRFNSKWLVNLYGGMFGVDYTPTLNDMISIGSDIVVTPFYFKPHNSRLPGRCRYSNTSFRPMIRYKRRIISNLYLDLEAGVSIKMRSRVNGLTGTKEYINCKQSPSPFIQLSATYSL